MYKKSTGKFRIDLQKIAFDELVAFGFNNEKLKSLKTAHIVKDIYFSYRRDGADTKRMIGFICFEA